MKKKKPKLPPPSDVFATNTEWEREDLEHPEGSENWVLADVQLSDIQYQEKPDLTMMGVGYVYAAVDGFPHVISEKSIEYSMLNTAWTLKWEDIKDHTFVTVGANGTWSCGCTEPQMWFTADKLVITSCSQSVSFKLIKQLFFLVLRANREKKFYNLKPLEFNNEDRE